MTARCELADRFNKSVFEMLGWIQKQWPSTIRVSAQAVREKYALAIKFNSSAGLDFMAPVLLELQKPILDGDLDEFCRADVGKKIKRTPSSGDVIDFLLILQRVIATATAEQRHHIEEFCLTMLEYAAQFCGQ